MNASTDHQVHRIQNVEQTFKTKKGLFLRAARHQPDRGQGRVRGADRPLGLRQVHPAQPDRRPDHAHRGVLLCANREIAGPGPERAVVFQNHSLLPWLTCFENVYLGWSACLAAKHGRSRKQGAAQGPHRRRAGAGGPDARRAKAPRRNLRRHEAARGHCPRPGDGAQGAADGRALRRAGRPDPRQAAGRAAGDRGPHRTAPW